MNWIYLAFGAALSWGFYGAMLHRGQVSLGNPMTFVERPISAGLPPITEYV